MKNLAALALVSSLAFSLTLACGGTVVFEEDGGGAGGDGGGRATSVSGVTTSGTVTATGAGGGTSIVAAQAAAGTSSQAAGPGGELTVVRVEPKIGANCKPKVGSDPMSGSVLVEYENLSNEVGSLEIVRADVIFSSRVEGWVFPIDLSPTSSGEVSPGERISVEHQKVATDLDSSFVCQLCGFPGSVTLYFQSVDGGELQASGPFDLSCAL